MLFDGSEYFHSVCQINTDQKTKPKQLKKLGSSDLKKGKNKNNKNLNSFNSSPNISFYPLQQQQNNILRKSLQKRFKECENKKQVSKQIRIKKHTSKVAHPKQYKDYLRHLHNVEQIRCSYQSRYKDMINKTQNFKFKTLKQQKYERRMVQGGIPGCERQIQKLFKQIIESLLQLKHLVHNDKKYLLIVRNYIGMRKILKVLFLRQKSIQTSYDQILKIFNCRNREQNILYEIKHFLQKIKDRIQEEQHLQLERMFSRIVSERKLVLSMLKQGIKHQQVDPQLFNLQRLAAISQIIESSQKSWGEYELISQGNRGFQKKINVFINQIRRF